MMVDAELDLAPYWERLGLVPDVASGEEGHDVALLDAVIQAHQRHIVFEALDTFCDMGHVVLDPESLYDKIIVNGRGGFCFELNALFGAFLKQIGFETFPVIARNTRNTTTTPPIMHRAQLVTIANKLRYADVGYGGPMASCSLEVKDGTAAVCGAHEFALSKASAAWWEIGYRRAGSDAGFKQILLFQDFPAKEADFVPLSWYCETHPQSPFVNNLILNLGTEDGHINLRNNVFTRVTALGAEKTEYEWDELRGVIMREFGIEVPDWAL